jgi:hypothetical protein
MPFGETAEKAIPYKRPVGIVTMRLRFLSGFDVVSRQRIPIDPPRFLLNSFCLGLKITGRQSSDRSCPAVRRTSQN